MGHPTYRRQFDAWTGIPTVSLTSHARLVATGGRFGLALPYNFLLRAIKTSFPIWTLPLSDQLPCTSLKRLQLKIVFWKFGLLRTTCSSSFRRESSDEASGNNKHRNRLTSLPAQDADLIDGHGAMGDSPGRSGQPPAPLPCLWLRTPAKEGRGVGENQGCQSKLPGYGG